MSYAVIKSGGQQFKVAEGDVIDIQKIEGDPGFSILFSEVVLTGEGSSVKVGGALSGATVTGEIVAQIKAPKVIAYKYKRRKGYHRTVGHRQKLTKVKITSIAA